MAVESRGHLRGQSRWAVCVAVLLSATAIAACSSSSKSGGASSSGSSNSATSGTGSSAAAASGGSDATLHALLPDSIKSSGTITLGTTTGAAPIDFASSSGQLQGLGIDLGQAVGQILGVKVKFVETTFNGLVAGLAAKRWDAAWAAMNDTTDREKQATFIDYLEHGFGVLVPKGNPKKVATEANFCGLNFGQIQASVFQTLIPTISKSSCTSQGKPAIKLTIYSDSQSEYQALSTGRIDAIMAAQEQVTYQAGLTSTIQAVPNLNIMPVHYGIGVLTDNSGLIQAVQGALSKMLTDGSYTKILTKWNLQAQAVDKIVLNTPAAS